MDLNNIVSLFNEEEPYLGTLRKLHSRADWYRYEVDHMTPDDQIWRGSIRMSELNMLLDHGFDVIKYAASKDGMEILYVKRMSTGKIFRIEIHNKANPAIEAFIFDQCRRHYRPIDNDLSRALMNDLQRSYPAPYQGHQVSLDDAFKDIKSGAQVAHECKQRAHERFYESQEAEKYCEGFEDDEAPSIKHRDIIESKRINFWKGVIVNYNNSSCKKPFSPKSTAQFWNGISRDNLKLLLKYHFIPMYVAMLSNDRFLLIVKESDSLDYTTIDAGPEVRTNLPFNVFGPEIRDFLRSKGCDLKDE